MTLIQNSAKITKFRQSEHIFGNFSLQPPSYIHSLPKKLNFRQKVQIFVGGQKETTLVTLMQNSAKITKFRQSELIFGNFSLQPPSYILSLPKKLNFRQKVQIFVGGQKETTLVTLMQNSAKITKFRQSEHIFGNFSLQSPSYIHSLPKENSIFAKKCNFS